MKYNFDIDLIVKLVCESVQIKEPIKDENTNFILNTVMNNIYVVLLMFLLDPFHGEDMRVIFQVVP